VWAWLTENEKLKQWFLELRIGSLQEGGKILFDMSNGTFEEMEILKLIHESDYNAYNLHPAGYSYLYFIGCKFLFS